MKKKIIIVIILAIIVIILSVIFYNQKNKIKAKIKLNDTITEIGEYKNKSTNIDIDKINNIRLEEVNNYYYYIINTYDNYKLFKNDNIDIVEINEEGMKDNAIIVIIGKNEETINKVFDKILENGEVMEICLKTDDSLGTNAISILVPKADLKDKVDIFAYSDREMKMSKYLPLRELSEVYGERSAIADNCVIVDYINKKVDNSELLDNFINDVNNGKESDIRIYRKDNGADNAIITIIDIEFIPEVGFYIGEDRTRIPYYNMTYLYSKINSKSIQIIDNKLDQIIKISDENSEFMINRFK